MKSIRYVFCRGLFALGLMAVGVGSGVGLPRDDATAKAPECRNQVQVEVAIATKPGTVRRLAITRARVSQPAEAS